MLAVKKRLNIIVSSKNFMKFLASKKVKTKRVIFFKEYALNLDQNIITRVGKSSKNFKYRYSNSNSGSSSSFELELELRLKKLKTQNFEGFMLLLPAQPTSIN